MKTKKGTAILSSIVMTGFLLVSSESWTQTKDSSTQKTPNDAVMEAQTSKVVPITRPEQKKNEHDLKDIFIPTKAEPSSTAFKEQPEEGKMEGFEFYRDPLNAKKPKMTFDEIYKADVADKSKVMKMQKELLEKRYNLKPNLSSDVKMTRGKPIPVGPTARLAEGNTWDSLAAMKAEEIRDKNVFPYPPLPHPKQVAGGQVFPKIQIDMFPRLQRFDVDFDLPDAFLPEFPPAIFLQNRPELGDVSRGEVVSINNFHRLFKDLLTPVQLDGLRLLLTPLPRRSLISPMTARLPCRAWVLPAWTVMSTATPPPNSTSVLTSDRRNAGSDWIPPVCVACSTSRFMAQSEAFVRWRISPNSSRGPLISTAIPSMP